MKGDLLNDNRCGHLNIKYRKQKNIYARYGKDAWQLVCATDLYITLCRGHVGLLRDVRNIGRMLNVSRKHVSEILRCTALVIDYDNGIIYNAAQRIKENYSARPSVCEICRARAMVSETDLDNIFKQLKI